MTQQTQIPQAPGLIKLERVETEVEAERNVQQIQLNEQKSGVAPAVQDVMAQAKAEASQSVEGIKAEFPRTRVEPVEIIEDRELQAQYAKAVDAMSVDEAFNQAAQAQDRMEFIMSHRADNGRTDVKKAAAKLGTTEDAIINEMQHLGALVSQVQKINAEKLRFDAFERTARQPLIGPQAVLDPSQPQGFRQSREGGGMFGLMESQHGLPKDINFTIRADAVLDHLSLDDILNNSVTQTGGQITRAGIPSTHPGGGIPVDKFRNTQEIVMAVPYRNFFSPLIPRMACPEKTTSFIWLSEPEAGIGSGANEGAYRTEKGEWIYDVSNCRGTNNALIQAEVDKLETQFSATEWADLGTSDADRLAAIEALILRSNGGGRVAAVGENEQFPMQTISIEENEITVKKRAVFATMTNEQASDVPMAKAYLNDVIARLLAEDLEDQIWNGDGAGTGTKGNMRGILAAAGLRQAFDSNGAASLAGSSPAVTEFSELPYFLKYLRSMRTFWQRRNVGAGKAPSHLVLPFTAKMDLMEQRDTQGRFLWANTVTGDFSTLFGIPLVLSDYLPANTGALVNVGDAALVVKDGIRMEFGLNGEDFRTDRASVRVKHRCEMLYKRRKSFMELTALNNGV